MAEAAAAAKQGEDAAPKVGAIPDLYRNYNFMLSSREMGEVRFTECFGLGVRILPVRYRESGAGQIVRTLPGPVEYAEVTLRYGLTKTPALWDWLKEVLAGGTPRRNISIAMLDVKGTVEVLRWNLDNAWPCEWSGVAFDALGREVAIEELKLSFDSLTRA
jgi:phage tail-like protein